MAIDDKFDAIEKAFPEKEPYLPDELVGLAVKFVLPGIVTDALGKFVNDSVPRRRSSGQSKH